MTPAMIKPNDLNHNYNKDLVTQTSLKKLSLNSLTACSVWKMEQLVRLVRVYCEANAYNATNVYLRANKNM